MMLSSSGSSRPDGTSEEHMARDAVTANGSKYKISSLFDRLARSYDGVNLSISFENKTNMRKVIIDNVYDKIKSTQCLFMHDEPVCGTVMVRFKGSSLAHKGITIELFGCVTVVGGSECRREFLHQERVCAPGVLRSPAGVAPIPFRFTSIKEHESYCGINVKVEYTVKATVALTVRSASVKEHIWVSRISEPSAKKEGGEEDREGGEQLGTERDPHRHLEYYRSSAFGPNSVSMEVGVDNSLHIEFEYNKAVFSLTDCVLGKVSFKVVGLDLQWGEVAVQKQECVRSPDTVLVRGSTSPEHVQALPPGARANDIVEIETLQKFEIMDGTPPAGQVVPLRLFLAAIPRLTPTYKDVEGMLSVTYYLNLMLIDKEDRRYFKRQEITLYRRSGQEAPVPAVVGLAAVE